MRRSLAYVIVAGLLLASAGALATPGKSGEARGKAPAHLGAFSVEGGSRNVTGDHLSFTYDDHGISNFRTQDRTLFAIVVTGLTDDEDDDREDGPPRGARTDGAMIRVRTATYSFTAHDIPSAVGKLQTDGSATITFADGVVLSPTKGDAVRFSFGVVAGVLRGDHLRVSGQNVTARDEVLVFIDEARGTFDRHRGDIGTAIAIRHVGLEGTFNADDTDKVVQDFVSYGNVTMRTLKAEKGNLTVEVEGHGFEGRVIVLNVDGRVLGAENADALRIMLDNQSIAHANNFTDILDPDDDGYAPEYYVVYDPGAHAFQLVITVPHYSVHTLSVTTILEVLTPSVAIGIVAGIALLVPAGLVLFRRK